MKLLLFENLKKTENHSEPRTKQRITQALSRIKCIKCKSQETRISNHLSVGYPWWSVRRYYAFTRWLNERLRPQKCFENAWEWTDVKMGEKIRRIYSTWGKRIRQNASSWVLGVYWMPASHISDNQSHRSPSHFRCVKVNVCILSFSARLSHNSKWQLFWRTPTLMAFTISAISITMEITLLRNWKSLLLDELFQIALHTFSIIWNRCRFQVPFNLLSFFSFI